jgi:putative ABC transport system permease protein
VEEQLSKVGDNLIWVEAGSRARNGVRIGSRGTKTLTVGDSQAVLEQVPGIKSAAPNADGRVQAIYGNLNWGTQYRGVSPEFFEIRKWEVRLGAAFTQDDMERNAAVCVLGQTVAANLFEDEDPIGRTINIKSVPFKVIGVLSAGLPWVTSPVLADVLVFVIAIVIVKFRPGGLWSRERS